MFLDRMFRAFGHRGVFEAGATLEMRVARRDNGGTAFADLVWKPRVLIEMKKAGEDLSRHYRQAFEYWIDLVPDRPKYVVLCNFDEIWIYNLNEQLDDPVDRIALADLPRRWEALSFLLYIEERPTFRNDLVAVTREAAARVATIFNLLLVEGRDREEAQRFILQVVIAMFAEDVGLLPRHSYTSAIDDSLRGGSAFDLVFGLFREMNTQGQTPAGRYAGTPYFNGGLFRQITPFDPSRPVLEALHDIAQFDWAAVRPSIFGTLFEQSLDRGERHAYGAHFTSEADIQKIVLPAIVRPWRQRIERASSLAELGLLEAELLRYRVLDPACGCGNFLYIAYRELRRLEKLIHDRVGQRQRRARTQQATFAFVAPTQFFGIDIRPFAVEIAKVTLMLARKLSADELGDEHTVLPLDDLDANFIAGDALQVEWPKFDVCIGNPPYLGRRRLIEERGAEYSSWLAEKYPDIRGVSDYVVYWFRKTHDLMPSGGRAGLVGTNTVRQGDTRVASLDYITSHGGSIYEAVSTQPWSGDAAVSVSIVNWSKDLVVSPKVLWLNDGALKLEVDNISSSLATTVDVRAASQIDANRRPKVCFQGQTPGHTEGFVLDGDEAREILARDGDRGVVHPFLIGDELLHFGRSGRFVIDFATDDPIIARQESPTAFDRIRTLVLPFREKRAAEEARRNAEVLQRRPAAAVNWHHRAFLDRWWQLAYRRADMVRAVGELDRFIALSIVASEHRPPIFAFVSSAIRPNAALQVFAFDDDYSFGILQSSLHRRWFMARCSTLESRPRYTPNTVFDSFPWPQAPAPREVDAIVSAVADLLQYRQDRVSEGIALADQYDSLREPGRNRLRDLHSRLDMAVQATYGFTDQEDSLTLLLALNEDVAHQESEGPGPRAPGPIGLQAVRLTQSRIEPPNP